MKDTSLLLRYGVAVLAIGVAFLIKLLLDPLIMQDDSFLLIFGSIMASTWYGSTGSREARDHQRRLPLSEKRFRALVRNSSDIITVIDAEGTISYVSPAVERVMGYEPETFIGKSVFDYVRPEDLPEAQSIFAKSLSQPGMQEPFEFQLLHKDGTPRHFEFLLNNLLDDPSIKGVVINQRDITERKEVEKTLKESERRFRQLFENSSDALFIHDEKGRFIDCNAEACRALGYTREELLALSVTDVATRLISDEVRREGQTLWQRALRGEPGRIVGMDDNELRRKDGTTFPVEVGVGSIEHEDRRMIFATARDITERKKAEAHIRFQAQLLEHVETAVIATDLQGSITHWNDFAEKLYGWAREEALGRSLAELTLGPERAEMAKEIIEQLQIGQRWAGEHTARRKDGTTFPSYMTASLVYDAEERPVGIVSISTDITERKQVENNLRRNLSILLALREAGQVLGSTLKSEEIVTSLLEIMRSVSDLTAAVISVHDETGNLCIWRSVGLEGLWRRARFTPEAESARLTAMKDEEQRLFYLRHPDSESESLVGLCLPLKVKDHVIGVLEAYGLDNLARSETAEILSSLASQAASALENARLYGELGEREQRLQELVEKQLGAQEEERHRVAYEVHDGLAQVAVAAHQHLQAFARRYAPSTQQGQQDLERILRLVRATVSDARRIIANLRPTALDDLGLSATIALEVERLREEGYQVRHEDALGNDRLPNSVEIAIFRITQEALTNVRKYAQTRRVRIQLRRRKDEVRIKIRDYGRGFDPTATFIESGPGERVGLHSMRERVSIIGGTLEIHSLPDVGTSVVASLPVREVP